MNQSEIGCFILLILGVLTTFSPLWTPGGLFGWHIILSIIAAAIGICFGIAAGIVGLVSNRARRERATLKDAASKPGLPEN